MFFARFLRSGRFEVLLGASWVRCEVFLTFRDRLPGFSSSVGVLAVVLGWSWQWSVSAGVAALGVGLSEAVSAGSADLFSSALVLVLGGDVSDAFVQPVLVVVGPDAFGLPGEIGGTVQRVEVGVLVFEVPEE